MKRGSPRNLQAIRFVLVAQELYVEDELHACGILVPNVRGMVSAAFESNTSGRGAREDCLAMEAGAQTAQAYQALCGEHQLPL